MKITIKKLFRKITVGVITSLFVATGISVNAYASSYEYMPFTDGKPDFMITEINPTDNTFKFKINMQRTQGSMIKTLVIYYPVWTRGYMDPIMLSDLPPMSEWAKFLAVIQDENGGIISQYYNEETGWMEYEIKSLLPIKDATMGSMSSETKEHDLFITVGIGSGVHWSTILSFKDCIDGGWERGKTCVQDEDFTETESHYKYVTYHAEDIVKNTTVQGAQSENTGANNDESTDGDASNNENNGDSEDFGDSQMNNTMGSSNGASGSAGAGGNVSNSMLNGGVGGVQNTSQNTQNSPQGDSAQKNDNEHDNKNNAAQGASGGLTGQNKNVPSVVNTGVLNTEIFGDLMETDNVSKQRGLGVSVVVLMITGVIGGLTGFLFFIFSKNRRGMSV